LGGIVAWLCQEIERQGQVTISSSEKAAAHPVSLVSALHLDVLQNLVLGDSFPEPLLRVNAGVIAGLLDPASNLQAVFASSGFDANGVRARLEALGITCVPGKQNKK
jgi:mediator of RNA polymerase II transcription subunit 5